MLHDAICRYVSSTYVGRRVQSRGSGGYTGEQVLGRVVLSGEVVGTEVMGCTHI